MASSTANTATIVVANLGLELYPFLTSKMPLSSTPHRIVSNSSRILDPTSFQYRSFLATSPTPKACTTATMVASIATKEDQASMATTVVDTTTASIATMVLLHVQPCIPPPRAYLIQVYHLG